MVVVVVVVVKAVSLVLVEAAEAAAVVGKARLWCAHVHVSAEWKNKGRGWEREWIGGGMGE